ncbi:hypothetical protein JYT25_00795, partial [bacterium AH-315-C20]|nr:hypothetical protein [bacterium AH-315-C20]
MKRSLIYLLVFACSNFSFAQTTTTSTVRPATAAFTGWDGTGPNFGPLEIRNNFTEPIEFFTNNVERMTIRGQVGFNEGFVGINENNPQFRLDIDGQLNISDNIFIPNTGYRINGIPMLQQKNNGNLFVGENAGFSFDNSTAFQQNTMVGTSAGQLNTSGGHNSFFGFESGTSNVNGDDCTFLGYRAGLNNVGGGVDQGDKNTFVGAFSGEENTTGRENTYVGFQTGRGVTTGIQNTMVGSYNAGGTSSGSRNTLIGHDAGLFLTTGNENSILGAGAGEFINTGRDNVLLGFHTARFITSGSRNVIGGNRAANDITFGSDNVIFGFEA